MCQIVITFVLVDFAWIFFRADSMGHAMNVIGRMLHINNAELLANGTLYDIALNQKNFVVLAIAILILLVADIFKYNGVQIRNVLINSFFLFRWIVCIIGVVSILIFGIWGSGYQETNFIYFQF